jgi:toxin ParE1/3/4
VTAKPVIPRRLAQQDIEATVAHYLEQGGEALALRFIEAVESAFARIGRYPGVGSPRYAYELGIEGLRAWPLRHFPYLVFYREEANQLDVWRLLHAGRDIPGWMRDET